MKTNYPQNLNPDTVKVIEFEGTENYGNTNYHRFEIVEKKFNIMDFIHPKFLELFGYDDILEAIYATNTTYYNLISHSNYSSPLLNKNLIDSYHYKNLLNRMVAFHKIQDKQKYDKFTKQTKMVQELEYYVYSTFSYAKLIEYIFRKRFEFLNQDFYFKNVEKEINIGGNFNYISYNSINDLPQELKEITVNELLSNPKFKSYKVNVKDFRIHIYTTTEVKPNEMYFNIPVTLSDTTKEISIHIDFDAFLNGDWETIKNRTTTYVSKYYGSDKWAEALFDTDDAKKLEADIKSIQNNTMYV